MQKNHVQNQWHPINLPTKTDYIGNDNDNDNEKIFIAK